MMVRLETITSPHSPAYLSISRQLDCFKELPTFTLPELAAYMTAALLGFQALAPFHTAHWSLWLHAICNHSATKASTEQFNGKRISVSHVAPLASPL